MANKTILITGGSRGIGAATAILAAGRGYNVAFSYRNSKGAALEVVRVINAAGGNARAFGADVKSEKEVVQLFDNVVDQFGQLDALVNNAGTIERQSRFKDFTVNRFENLFYTNVLGSFLCAREAIRRMGNNPEANGGAIVNVSSIASKTGSPFEYIDYAASKGAIDSFTIGLAREVASEGIRVNAVRPGFIFTGIHKMGGEPDRVTRLESTIPMLRGGNPEEVANAILWLLSDEASYVTGSIIDLAGGK